MGALFLCAVVALVASVLWIPYHIIAEWRRSRRQELKYLDGICINDGCARKCGFGGMCWNCEDLKKRKELGK